MNEYDSKKIIDLLHKSHNMSVTVNEKEADLFIVNTCSVREGAQEKLFHQLGRWHKYKKKNSSILIAVGGCVASQEGSAILDRAPYVNIIFGPQTLHRLPNMLNNSLTKKQVQIDTTFPAIEKFDNLAKPKSNGVSSYVSVMEGCSKYCTFCIVPYTRGEEVSRPLNDIIKEVQELVSQGVKEINLLGQNVNGYRGLMDDGNCADLALLIEIIDSMDGVCRIRYTTSHPVHFSDRLVLAYKNCKKLVSHLHLPIQSGSDKVLSLMKRGHTVLQYKSTIRKLRRIRVGISISSDFIIGFPGEDEGDFNSTLDLVDEIVFDKSFSFIYSKRPGTIAASFVDDLSLGIKKARLLKLQEKIASSAKNISSSMVGSVQTSLVEGVSKTKNTLVARTENNRSVHFNGNNNLIGKLVKLKITRAISANSLSADVID